MLRMEGGGRLLALNDWFSGISSAALISCKAAALASIIGGSGRAELTAATAAATAAAKAAANAATTDPTLTPRRVLGRRGAPALGELLRRKLAATAPQRARSGDLLRQPANAAGDDRAEENVLHRKAGRCRASARGGGRWWRAAAPGREVGRVGYLEIGASPRKARANRWASRRRAEDGIRLCARARCVQWSRARAFCLIGHE